VGRPFHRDGGQGMGMVDRRLIGLIAAIHTAVSAVIWMPVNCSAATEEAALSSVQSSPSAIASPMPTATPTPPGTIRVEVVLLRGGERLPGDDSVAWLPDIPASSGSTTKVAFSQRDKQFDPRLAVVSVGSTIDFPNYDRVFHNVFSLSAPKTFDLGLYRRGKSKSVRFDRPGLVQIYCNIHPHMAAFLMIVESGRHGVADTAGVINLENIPAGMHTVAGWNVRGGMWSREVAVRSGRTTSITIEIDISNWREAPHLNKYGKEYPPPDDDDFRY
jgi:plastocyanin